METRLNQDELNDLADLVSKLLKDQQDVDSAHLITKLLKEREELEDLLSKVETEVLQIANEAATRKQSWPYWYVPKKFIEPLCKLLDIEMTEG